MKILFVNGSPRGRYSVTLQSCLYLEKRFPQHRFEHLNVGTGIDIFERDMSGAAAALASAELIIFAYPVYSFLVPSQLHRFIELLKGSGIPLRDKYVSQLTTSKHFFDITAHRFIEENCRDMGMRVIKGLSADSEDLLSEKGQQEAESFLEYAVFCAENALYEKAAPVPSPVPAPYENSFTPVKKDDGFDVVIVGNLADGDESLRAMIKDFDAVFPYRTRFVNLADFPFKGGCLGCLNCTINGKCVYTDGFDSFLEKEIANADAVVYAFTLRDHSMGSRFKMFDDRQFCRGYRAICEGKPSACICSGDLSGETNLLAVLEARCQVGHSFFAGAADGADSIQDVSKRLAYALKKELVPPTDFTGAGGMKILRDTVWLERGMMRADHEYFRANGLYDFPQRKLIKMLRTRILGALMKSPAIRRRIGNRFNDTMLAPYRKILKKL